MMRTILVLSIAFCLVNIMNGLHAQVENLIVETYYVADSNDAKDTTGGGIQQDAVTYRIYVDLAEDLSLKTIFGNNFQPLIIQSTSKFFNNADRGELFGQEIRKSRLDENTVALDTWLTLGFATGTEMGVLKVNDTDGSIVGGENNDGGSAEIEGGLLVNADPEMGIPLTTADGLMANNGQNTNYFALGISDTSIFGDTTKTIFYSENATYVSNEGIKGLDSENIILLAQLTTSGEISFNLNLEVADISGKSIKYVSRNENLKTDEFFSPLLSYPPPAGCTDPWFVEFNPAAVEDDGSCQDSIVLGCMDMTACNYDPEANFNIQELCCYGPQNCDNRDISIVCPDYKKSGSLEFDLYPNPAGTFLNLSLSSQSEEDAVVYIFDSFGTQWIQKNLGNIRFTYDHQIDLNSLKPGMYMIRVFTSEGSASRLFIKE